MPDTDMELKGKNRKLSTEDAVVNGKNMKVLSGNTEKERNESKVPTGNLERNGTKTKCSPQRRREKLEEVSKHRKAVDDHFK